MTTEKINAETQVVEDDGTKVDMVDPNVGLVDLDADKGDEEGQQGVSAEDEGRAAIYAKHAEKRLTEVAGIAPDGAGVTDSAVDAPDDDVTVKVNGKERKVARAKVEAAGGVDAYQKNAAASELLNQASAEMRRLRDIDAEQRRRDQELLFREHELEAARAAAEKKPPADLPDEGDRKALAREYHEAMVDGDMDKADDLLIKMQAAPKATAVNPDEVAQRAVKLAKEELAAEERKKAAAKAEKERLEAVTEFEEKHSDLAEDEELRTLVDVKTVEIYREHPDWGPKAIVTEAIKSVRTLVSRIKGGTTADDKLAAKRSLSVVRGGSARAVSRPAPAPQTKSQYVEQLRKQRGLE